MKLRNDFKKILENNIKYYGLKINKKENSIHDLTLKILNYRNSIFTNTPYNLNFSKHFLESLKSIPIQYQCYSMNILNMLKRGDIQVNKFLTKNIKRSSFYDDFRILWGLYHLHIEKNGENEIFSKRSNYLLILYKVESEIYLVDIVEHGEKYLWYKKRFLEIIDNEWPDILPRLNGVSGSDLSEEEIKKYRNKNINTTININGKAIMPTINGISTNGTPFQDVRESDFMELNLEKIEDYFQIKHAIYPHRINYTFFRYENYNFYLIKDDNFIRKVVIISFVRGVSFIKEVSLSIDSNYMSMIFDRSLSYVWNISDQIYINK